MFTFTNWQTSDGFFLFAEAHASSINSKLMANIIDLIIYRFRYFKVFAQNYVPYTHIQAVVWRAFIDEFRLVMTTQSQCINTRCHQVSKNVTKPKRQRNALGKLQKTTTKQKKRSHRFTKVISIQWLAIIWTNWIKFTLISVDFPFCFALL